MDNSYRKHNQESQQNAWNAQTVFKGSPPKNLSTISTTILRPILEYSSPVWSPYNVNQIRNIEKIQRQAIRWVYKIPKRTGLSELMTTKDITELEKRRDEFDISFLRKIKGDFTILKLKITLRKINHITQERG